MDREDVRLGIRPEHVVLGEGGVSATVVHAVRRDVATRVTLAREGHGEDGEAVVEAYAADPPAVGAVTTVRFPGERVVWFPREERPADGSAGIEQGKDS